MKKYLLMLVLFALICTLLVSSTLVSIPETEWLQNENKNNVDSKSYITTSIIDEAYKQTNHNTMFSPLSLDMAIGMVSKGASDSAQFDKFLCNNEYSAFARKYLNYVDSLNSDMDNAYSKYKAVFEVTNSLWIDNQLTLKPEFEYSLTSYALEAQFVEFQQKSDVVADINNWGYNKTHGMIRKIISENDIGPKTKLLAINAVYFESPWCEAWNVVKSQMNFTKFGGEKINSKFIETNTSTYFENDQATAFGVEYQNGLTFVGILPKAAGEFTTTSLNIDELLSSKTTQYDVSVKMPTFKFENKIENLKNTLCNMGYEGIFAEEILDNMVLRNNSPYPITVDNILQMNAIELDENGTKAAAVTTIIGNGIGGVIPAQKQKNVVLDRPFAFLIYDSKMNQIIFIGKVVDPS